MSGRDLKLPKQITLSMPCLYTCTLVSRRFRDAVGRLLSSGTLMFPEMSASGALEVFLSMALEL